jgi:hypothetical protein
LKKVDGDPEEENCKAIVEQPQDEDAMESLREDEHREDI